MQFFEHQDQARGRTTLLVALFIFSVIALGAVSAVATHFALTYDLQPDEAPSEHHNNFVATAAILTWGVIFLGSVYRLSSLRGGGVTVAEALGGTLVTAQSPDLLERRAVNVVEEMAIAAGLPVPPVYVMKTEAGINAFAAGWSPDDAVIGVTKGTLEGLNRDQLQGVIAHEFSHILNRDCALNMRLMGVLHGIVIISVIGRTIIHFGSGSRHRSSRSDSTAHFMIVGGAIWLFGSLGVFAARIIQAAVSRQREYLADASAVQFTRNPEGIGGALATIGSQTSLLGNAHGSETSHMLISEPTANHFLGALASHPPLFDRIQRVLPRWNGEFAALATPEGSVRKRLESRAANGEDDDDEKTAQDLLFGGLPTADGFGASGRSMESSVLGALILDEVAGGGAPASPTQSTTPGQGRSSAESSDGNHPPLEQARRLLASVPPQLRAAAENPFSARALILAWILDDRPEDRQAQLALVSREAPLADETVKLSAGLETLNQTAVLPLFDVALGTLAALSAPQMAAFHALLSGVEARLSKSSYRGYCLAALALRHLGEGVHRTKNKSLLIKDAIETVLGVMAQEGHEKEEEARRAFADGVSQLGKRGEKLRMPNEAMLNVTNFDLALGTLLRLPVSTRTQLLTAAELIASHDGILNPAEAELLRAMATCLNVATRPAFATGP